jgi:tetratricopeptide (TPR) repeat protein
MVEAAANAANTERNRSAALLALTWHLLDEQTARLAPGPSGRERTTSDVPTQSVPDQHPTTSSVPCVALQRLGDRLVRKHLTEEPERLLMLTTFLALEEQPPQRFNTGEHAWSELRAAIVDEPSLILRWTPRLSSNAIQRLEAVAAAVVSSSPAPTTLAVSLADFEALLGRYQVAEKWYRHVLKTEPKHVQTLNNLAWMLGLREKSLDEAQALIDRAIKVAGNEPRLLDTRGVVALARKENDKALRDLENSLRHQPGPVTALHLARARLQKGDQAGAKEALRLILADGMTEAHFHPLERPTFEALRRALNE